MGTSVWPSTTRCSLRVGLAMAASLTETGIPVPRPAVVRIGGNELVKRDPPPVGYRVLGARAFAPVPREPTLDASRRDKDTIVKKDIHPPLNMVTVTCACGNTFQTRSTQDEVRLEICSECHPFFSGKQKLIDTAGRVERFKRRYSQPA